MRITTRELNTFKENLIKGIRESRNFEEVRYNCYVAISRDECDKYVFQAGELEQVRQDIAAFEAEQDAGMLGIDDAEVHRRMREELPWLKGSGTQEPKVSIAML